MTDRPVFASPKAPAGATHSTACGSHPSGATILPATMDSATAASSSAAPSSPMASTSSWRNVRLMLVMAIAALVAFKSVGFDLVDLNADDGLLSRRRNSPSDRDGDVPDGGQSEPLAVVVDRAELLWDASDKSGSSDGEQPAAHHAPVTLRRRTSRRRSAAGLRTDDETGEDGAPPIHDSSDAEGASSGSKKIRRRKGNGEVIQGGGQNGQRGGVFRLPSDELPHEGWTQRKAKVLTNFTNMPLDVLSGPNENALPGNGSFICELFLIGLPRGVCKIVEGEEDMMECIDRVGGRTLERSLPSKCSKSAWWKSVRERGPDYEVGRDIPRDAVYQAQTVRHDAPPWPYIPPSERTFRHVKSLHCKYADIHPIVFGIPSMNVVNYVSRDKYWDFLPNKLRKFPPYVFAHSLYRLGFQDEYLTSQMHRRSYFVFTHKRGGWDCMRHVEILAAGAVPYFADLRKCWKNCLALLPKSILLKVLDMPGVKHIGSLGGPIPPNPHFIDPQPQMQANMNYVTWGQIDWSTFNESYYFEVADELLSYTKKYLTTRSTAAYLLHKIGYEDPKHVFVVGRDHMDYLELLTEQGFAELGINYTANYPRKRWHQVREPEAGSSWTAQQFEDVRRNTGLDTPTHGACMVVGLRIPPLTESTENSDIIRKLQAGVFDLVVYTWPHWPVQQYPFWEHVYKVVPKSRIVFVDGGDDGNDPHNDFQHATQFGHVFRRELHDGPC